VFRILASNLPTRTSSWADPMVHTKGLRVAMLGPDGIGKTTLSENMRDQLAAMNVDLHVVSWRRLIDGSPAPAPYPQTAFEQLWVEDWRLLYGGGSVEGEPVDERIPRTFEEFASLRAEETFPLGAEGVRSSGPLASGLIEVALDFVIEAEVVRPKVAEGAVVVRESYGYKPVLKALLIAAACQADTVPRTVVERMVTQVTDVYADPFLQPDIGILLAGTAGTAYTRRSGEGRGIGVAEDYALCSQTGEESFLSLQQECAVYFEKAADAWGWYRLDVGDRPPQDLGTEIVHHLLAPRLWGDRG
jgi:thymidylate kinase